MNIFDTADILIPKDVDFKKWSIVACDQYTSDKEYWKAVEEEVGEEKSALNLIFPEIYLRETDRVEKINKNMADYIESGVFKELSDSFILVKRSQKNEKTRVGILGRVDLEQYEFSKKSDAYIRATEGTVAERIPPRVKIRENAPLELPHIIMLIDDDKRVVVEPTLQKCESFEKLYDFDLMMDSGHVTGYHIPKDECQRIKDELSKMADKEYFYDKYGIDEGEVLVYAVGDGNHSLATAKTVWENLKPSLSDEEKENHPARYALVELMNIHDDALEFKPIHRVVYGTNRKIIDDFKAYCKNLSGNRPPQTIKATFGVVTETITIEHPEHNLTVGTLQRFLNDYIPKNNLVVDYIHGASRVRELAAQGAVGFIVPSIEKRQLFESVIRDGALPRKTFSMGSASDKRFYIESRKIK